MPKNTLVTDSKTGISVNVQPFFDFVETEFHGDYDAMVDSFRHLSRKLDSEGVLYKLLNNSADAFEKMVHPPE